MINNNNKYNEKNCFREIKGNWYYRCMVWDGKRQNEWTIPMRTKDKKVANRRYMDGIKPILSDIKDGHIQKFQLKGMLRWLNDEGKVKLVEKSLQDTIVEYIEYRSEMVRPSTLKRDKSALNQLMEFVGYTKAVKDLSYKDIEGKGGLINHLRSNKCTDVGINTTLRHIRVYFNWLFEKEKIISEPIKFKLIPEGVQLYHYFNECETNQIYHYIDVNGIDSFFKRCFHFHNQTGMRPTETLVGELVGDWYLIPAELRKNKIPMQLKLNEELKSILLEMQSFRDSKLHCKDANVRVVDILERTIMKIVRALGFRGKRLTLYSFRHSYAIRRITITGSIHDVMREMGHSNPQTTMRYLRFPEQRRLDDFPSLKEYIENRQDLQKSGSMVTKSMVTEYSNIYKLPISISN